MFTFLGVILAPRGHTRAMVSFSFITNQLAWRGTKEFVGGTEMWCTNTHHTHPATHTTHTLLYIYSHSKKENMRGKNEKVGSLNMCCLWKISLPPNEIFNYCIGILALSLWEYSRPLMTLSRFTVKLSTLLILCFLANFKDDQVP